MNSEAYHKLPDTEEDLKKKKESISKDTKNPFKEDEKTDKEDNEINDFNNNESTESIQYNIASDGYQEATILDTAGTTGFVAGA